MTSAYHGLSIARLANGEKSLGTRLSLACIGVVVFMSVAAVITVVVVIVLICKKHFALNLS